MKRENINYIGVYTFFVNILLILFMITSHDNIKSNLFTIVISSLIALIINIVFNFKASKKTMNYIFIGINSIILILSIVVVIINII